MSYDVFGLGNALVDALVVLDDHDIVRRHELHRGTMHLVNDARWQGVFDEVRELDVQMHPGGSCANTVSTVARLGAASTFCGLVGQDVLGDTYGARLAEIFGTHHLVTRAGAPTGKCLSLVSEADAERTMLTDLGAAMELDPGEVPLDAVEASRWLHITGYLFTGGKMADAARAALDRALRVGTKVSLDVGDGFVLEHFREPVQQVLERYVDIVFMNEEEARHMGDGDPLAGMLAVAQHVGTVVLKVGAKGSLIRHEGTLIPIEAVPVKAVDTTGAGDAYAGGFLYGVVRGWDLARCGRLGSEVAALTVAQVGGVVRDQALLAAAVARVAPGLAAVAVG